MQIRSAFFHSYTDPYSTMTAQELVMQINNFGAPQKWIAMDVILLDKTFSERAMDCALVITTEMFGTTGAVGEPALRFAEVLLQGSRKEPGLAVEPTVWERIKKVNLATTSSNVEMEIGVK